MKHMAALLLLACIASPAVAQSTFHGNVARTDVYQSAGPTQLGSVKWAFNTDGPIVTSPAIAGGTVFVGSWDGVLYALDATTGRLRWNFDAKSYVFSSAALSGDLAYVGSHNGRLYAVNAKSGTLAWQFQTEASKQDSMKALNPDGSLNQDAFAPVFGDFDDMYIDFYRFISIGAIMSSPVVDQGIVYVGSTDGNLYALN